MQPEDSLRTAQSPQRGDRWGEAPRWTCLVWGLFTLSGCGEIAPEQVISVENQRGHAPLLLSELRGSDPQKLLDTAFRLSNPSSREAVVRFDGAGCTCYDVTTPAGLLVKGDLLKIPPGESLSVDLGVSAPTAAGERQYEARLTHLGSAGEETSLPLTLTLPVYADLAVTPDVLTVGYRSGVASSPLRIQVIRCARQRELAAAPPELVERPAALVPGAWRQTSVEEVAPGLWRGTWEMELGLDLPDDFRDELTGTLVVRSTGSTESTSVNLLVRPQFGIRGIGPIHFGSLMRDTPRRRRVLLTAADRIPFRIIAAHSTDPRCRVVTTDDDPAPRHWVEIETSLPDDEPLEGRVVFETDHPDSPTVPLVVTARIRASEEACADTGDP